MSSETEYRQRFGARLFRLRREAGLPQHAVGDHAGVSHAAVQQWESGKTTPTSAKRQKLAELLGASFDDADVLAEPMPSAEEKPTDGRKLARVSSAGTEGDPAKAARLREARERAGHSSAASAAAAIGVAYSTYAGHESGLRGFRRTEVVRYAEAFAVTPEWLEFGSGTLPTIFAAPVSAGRRMTPATRAGIRSVLEDQRSALTGQINLHREMTAQAEGELEVVVAALAHLDRVEAPPA